MADIDMVQGIKINLVDWSVLRIDLALIVSLRESRHGQGKLVRERLDIFVGGEGGQADVFVADQSTVVADVVVFSDKAGKIGCLAEPNVVLMLLGEPAKIVEGESPAFK